MTLYIKDKTKTYELLNKTVISNIMSCINTVLR